MKRNFLLAIIASTAMTSFGTTLNEDIDNSLPQHEYTTEETEENEAGAINGYDDLDSGFTVDNKSEIIAGNQRFWRGGNKLFSIGYASGSFDKGRYFGGKLNSRWGAGIKTGRNIMLHPKPIANLMKFGLFIGAEITYLNFEKGQGSLSDLTGGYDNDYDGETVTLGSHYLTGGLAIGPTVTLMPFYWCGNANVARIKVRPFFHVLPSYSALVVSDEDDAEIHGALALFYSGGVELIWRKLSVGFEWKGGRARYKDYVSDLIGENYDNLWVGNENRKQPRMGCKMFTVSIGLEF